MRGIYEIINIKNNKIYVGESLDITNRWKDHIESLVKGTHHNYKLQSDFNQYGVDAFKFRIHILLNDDISHKVAKYLLLICENKRIDTHKEHDAELYNIDNSLESFINGRITSDFFNKTMFNTVNNNFKKGTYVFIGNVLFKSSTLPKLA